jgi:hypothetical protein
MQEGRFSQNIEKGLYSFIEKKEFLILKDLIKFFSEYSYCLGKKKFTFKFPIQIINFL